MVLGTWPHLSFVFVLLLLLCCTFFAPNICFRWLWPSRTLLGLANQAFDHGGRLFSGFGDGLLGSANCWHVFLSVLACILRLCLVVLWPCAALTSVSCSEKLGSLKNQSSSDISGTRVQIEKSQDFSRQTAAKVLWHHFLCHPACCSCCRALKV